MNNKMIIEFGSRNIKRIMEISEDVIRLAHLDLHNSSDDTQPHPIIVKYLDIKTLNLVNDSFLLLNFNISCFKLSDNNGSS